MNKSMFPLLRLLADGAFHSGERLGAQLGVTRATVWHAVRALEAQGLKLHKVRGRGYRLARTVDLLDAVRLRAASGAAFHIELLDVCASTNTLLLDRSRQGAPHASVVACELQQAGRGRFGRSWHSGIATSLTFSLLWRFAVGAGSLSGLSLAVAVAVLRAIEGLGLHGVQLKWPNDIMHGKMKLAGILIELQGEMSGPSAVVIGIGLNTGLTPALRTAIDQPVTDVASLAGSAPDRNVLLAALLVELARALEVFSRQGFAPFRDEWQRNHAYQNRRVRLRVAERRLVEGEALGVAEDGALLLRSARGVERYTSGEISLRRAL